ncbi:MAG: cytochrome C oxidase subunit IV family protein [Planctomycetes bacterium]|nr:cytochrome C oxidase subunit IV family protein [Planctomycetota bacterium]
MSSDPNQTPATPPGHNDVLGHVDSPPTLIMVWVAVLALFGLTVALSSSGMFGKYTLFVQLAIGTVQAGLVAYHFMHLRHGDRVVVLTALASIFWMGILFVLFMSDYMSRSRVMG